MSIRQIVLDTETTGLDTSLGHRIIEIGCVEIVNRQMTGETFHQYLQPDRAIDEAAQRVHGISPSFLKDKPRFSDISDSFLAFVEGAEIVAHNAPFDVGFINYELSLLRPAKQPIERSCVIVDSLKLARVKHPGQRNSLDALCKRYAVDSSKRELHGALLDAQLLADVYLIMTGGQAKFKLDRGQRAHGEVGVVRADLSKLELKTISVSDDELKLHMARLEAIKNASGQCQWLEQLEESHA